MKGLPYYKAYPRDFIESTIGMDGELKGAYRLVLDLIYMNGGKLPDDARYISGLLGYTIKKWKSYRAKLIFMGKIVINGEFLTNERAILELSQTEKIILKLQENGSRGGYKKAEISSKLSRNSPEISSKLDGNFTENECELNKNNDLTLANATITRVNTDTDTDISSLRSDITLAQNQDFGRKSGMADRDFENLGLGEDPKRLSPQEPNHDGQQQGAAITETEPQRLEVATGRAVFVEVEDLGNGAEAIPAKAKTKTGSKAAGKAAQKAQFEREFEEIFWPMVVKKVSRGEAQKAFIKARGKASLDEIVAGLERYQQNLIAKGTELQFWAYPATFLNKERWADEPEPIIENTRKKYHEQRHQNYRNAGKPTFTQALFEIDDRLDAFKFGREAGQHFSSDFSSGERLIGTRKKADDDDDRGSQHLPFLASKSTANLSNAGYIV